MRLKKTAGKQKASFGGYQLYCWKEKAFNSVCECDHDRIWKFIVLRKLMLRAFQPASHLDSFFSQLTQVKESVCSGACLIDLFPLSYFQKTYLSWIIIIYFFFRKRRVLMNARLEIARYSEWRRCRCCWCCGLFVGFLGMSPECTPDETRHLHADVWLLNVRKTESVIFFTLVRTL